MGHCLFRSHVGACSLLRLFLSHIVAYTIVYYVIIRNGHADSHERSLLEICEQLDQEEQGACASETFFSEQF